MSIRHCWYCRQRTSCLHDRITFRIPTRWMIKSNFCVILKHITNSSLISKKFNLQVSENKRRLVSQQSVVRACPKQARLDTGQGSMLAIPYAVLFQLQACSPLDELYAFWNYHGKQRNLQCLQHKVWHEVSVSRLHTTIPNEMQVYSSTYANSTPFVIKWCITD